MTLYQQKADELLAQYHESLAKVADLRSKLNEVSVSVAAPRNVVQVTVNGQGQVSALEFPTGAYKRTPPAELAATLLETIQEAARQATEVVRELISPEVTPGLNFMEMLRGKADAPAVFPEPQLPDEVREYIGYKPGEFSPGAPNG